MAFIGGGRLAITTAGTRRNLTQGTGDLTPNVPSAAVAVQALPANTALVYVGGPATLATLGSENGIGLAAGAVQVFQVDDLVDVWVDSRVSGEGVSFNYQTGD